MRDLAVLFIHLIATIGKLLGPGGDRSIIAESLLLKHRRERLRCACFNTETRPLGEPLCRPFGSSGGLQPGQDGGAAEASIFLTIRTVKTVS